MDTPSFGVVLAIMGAPWLLMFAAGLATRASIALPIEQRANWIFRMTERETTRVDQLRAVVCLMRQLTVGLPLILIAPLEWALFGPRAVFALAANAACALLWVEVLLRGWRDALTCVEARHDVRPRVVTAMRLAITRDETCEHGLGSRVQQLA